MSIPPSMAARETSVMKATIRYSSCFPGFFATTPTVFIDGAADCSSCRSASTSPFRTISTIFRS